MSVTGVQNWLKGAKYAQSVHRDNLADESSGRSVLFGLSKATLQAAPQLAQQIVQEQALAQKQQLQNAPKMGMPSLGPGSSSPGLNLSQLTPRNPRNTEGQE